MTRFNTLLLLAILVSALGVVTSQHQARKLFQAMDAEQARTRALDVEYVQWQLELLTHAESRSIEKSAREQLNMRAPDAARIVNALPGGHR
jgi:cell division protein FtsL